ncbi:MAG: SDR family NAD(P)-dependent oxidoreductase, partial [Pseudolabrys sp.]
ALAQLRATGAQAEFVEFDVTQEKSCKQAIEQAAKKFGRLDVLVNNAGTTVRKQPQDLTAEDWHLVMNTNLTSAFFCSQAAYAPMVKAGGGKIINTGSMMSLFGASYAAPYAASKGGIVQLTRSLAVAWAKDNIQVNAILPGWIDTDLTRKAREQVPGLNDKVMTRTPTARWGSPDDFAGIAVFLAAPASDFVTGAAIPIDGGYSVMA